MTKGNERTYMDREIDAKFGAIHDRLDLQDGALAKILAQTTYTNGKLKKVIAALVLIFGVAIGFGGKEVLPILIKLII